MKKISILAAALALGIPATAYAADCCKSMECCKDGAKCCEEKGRDAKSCCEEKGKGDKSCCDEKKRDDHAGHDKPEAPKN